MLKIHVIDFELVPKVTSEQYFRVTFSFCFVTLKKLEQIYFNKFVIFKQSVLLCGVAKEGNTHPPLHPAT